MVWWSRGVSCWTNTSGLLTSLCFPYTRALRAGTGLFLGVFKQSLAHNNHWISFWMVKWYKEGFPFLEHQSHCWFRDSGGISWSQMFFKFLMTMWVLSTLVILSILLRTCFPRKVIYHHRIILSHANFCQMVPWVAQSRGDMSEHGWKNCKLYAARSQLSSEALRRHCACWHPQHFVSSLAFATN